MIEASDLERARFLMKEGLDDDEAGSYKEALDHYTEAVDLCIKASNNTQNEDLKKKLNALAAQALDR